MQAFIPVAGAVGYAMSRKGSALYRRPKTFSVYKAWSMSQSAARQLDKMALPFFRARD